MNTPQTIKEFEDEVLRDIENQKIHSRDILSSFHTDVPS